VDNPAPFSLFLETPHGTVISSSPERLLAARDRRVESRPIKGTAARDPSPAVDRRLADGLLASEKNRAELLMITDLLRNDLGKVCEHGSVRVPQLVQLESFPHLHHLVSTVVGRLRAGLDVFDALEAVFPCGSITGAPKRRAMEILRDLEPVPRGVYTGTVGWVGFDRTADLAVAIRTGVLAEGVFSFGAGGGIVADSEAPLEWSELLLKARALALALGVDLESALCGREP
jgi:para-aminobenzoate synthetase component 1